MDSISREYPLDRTHHLLCAIRLRHGARLSELLQLLDRLVPLARRFSVGCQFGVAVALWRRVSLAAGAMIAFTVHRQN
jgi:hypothetical protein